MSFADYQTELYEQSRRGHQPQLPIRFDELQAKAMAAMPPKVRGYVVGAAGGDYPDVPSGCLADDTTDPVCREWLRPGEDATEAAVRKLPLFGGPFRWEDLDWLRSQTKLPLMLKGISHPDDVRRAIDHGADAMYVSNHGGRQANGGLPSLDCLPGVVAAAGDLPVLFDSGVRSGADIIKGLR